MLVSLCSGSHNTSPRNQTNTLVLKPSGMQLQAGSRQRGLPPTGRGRAAAHPLRAPLRARVAKLCAVDSSQLVVGYTTPDQYFAVADLHTACFHEPCKSPNDRTWHVFDRIWGLQVNASLARRGAGRCVLLVAFDPDAAPTEAVQKALAAAAATAAAEAAKAAAATTSSSASSSSSRSSNTGDSSRTASSRSTTSSSSSSNGSSSSSSSSDGSSSSSDGSNKDAFAGEVQLPEEFAFPRYGYWLSRLVDRTVWPGLGATHQHLGIVGVAQLDTFGDIIPPRTLSPQRDGAFGWVPRQGYAYISNVAVSPCAQRRGVARRLMAEAEALAGAWGCSKAGLHVNLANTPAVGLYRSLGYKKGALEAPWMPYLQGRAPDRCMLMLKRLPGSAQHAEQQQQQQHAEQQAPGEGVAGTSSGSARAQSSAVLS